MMFLREIKDYLQIFHTVLDENVLEALKKQKKKAIIEKNEGLANELWCLIETYYVHDRYLNMFQDLKHGKYKSAWLLLSQIDVSLGNLRENFGDGMRHYNLIFINNIIKNYEKIFPRYLFASRESIIKSEKCTICGNVVSLRSGCGHIPGKLYMGELCCREITDYEIIGFAIVQNPLDKSAILEIEDREYDYECLDYLMPELDSPFRPWYIEEQTIKKPEYIGLSRNDLCPCGSGLKYKRCCLDTEREWCLHYRVNILGKKMGKEKVIFQGRWVEKSDVD